MVDDTLTWSNHIEYISTKIKRGIGVIKKTSKYLDKHSLLMLYRLLVETHLRYCNIIWGQCNETLKDRLQVFQNKAARTVAKVKHENADHLRLICQLGWLTVQNLIRLDLGIFMYKVRTIFCLKQLENFIYQFQRFTDIKQGQLRQEMYFYPDVI